MIGLIDTAVVYTPHPTSGAYTVIANSALLCRLELVTVTADTGPQRAEVASARRLLWDAGYTMPETAQVEVSGARWNVQAGSFATVRGVGGAVVYNRADVVRAV